MRSKVVVCLCLVVFANNFLWSQTVIQGLIYSKTDEVKEFSATVVAYSNCKKGLMAGFAFSDPEGNFELKAKCECDSIILSIKSLSIEETVVKIKNISQHIEIPVNFKQYNIDEVVIKAPNIISRKDTTTYIVAGFAQKKDFSIGDVISKMPGFDVSPEGKISYQGQPIQKYYIEGLDLLEQRYALANSNIPHSSVASVEVLHNHQPVKVLEGLAETNQTSLNIKLKRNVNLTGRLEASAGGLPLVWDANITPMAFSRNMQAIGSWQCNNSGNDLMHQHQSIRISGGSISGATLIKQNYLGVPRSTIPEISKAKYLKNNVNLLSLNYLTKGKEGTEFKINGSYYNDWVDMHSSISSTYFMPDTILRLVENQSNGYQYNSLTLEATLTQNVSKRYLVNKLSYGGFWDSERAFISNIANQSVRSEIPHQTISNEFELVKPLNDNLLYVETVIDYNYSPQTLSFQPNKLLFSDGNSSEIGQEIANTNFIAQNRLKYSYPLKRFVASSTLEVNYHNETLKTSINKFTQDIVPDSLKNSLGWHRIDALLGKELEFKNKSIVVNISAPLRFVAYGISDRIHNANQNPNYWFFTPRGSVRYTPIPNLSTIISVAYNQSVSSPSSLTQGHIIVSHRLIMKNLSEIAEHRAIRYNASVVYRAPTLGLFTSFHYMGSHGKSNVLINRDLIGNGVFMYQSVFQDNYSSTNNLSSEIKWYFSAIKTTFGLNATLGDMSMQYLLNSKLTDFKQQIIEVKPNLLFNYSKHWAIDYTLELKRIIGQSDISKTEGNYNNQKVSIFSYPNSQHTLGMETEFYSSIMEGQNKNKAIFSNLLYSYKPKDKHISFRFQCKNLFNTFSYINHFENDFSIITTQYDLRPREFIFSILMSLNRGKSN